MGIQKMSFWTNSGSSLFPNVGLQPISKCWSTKFWKIHPNQLVTLKVHIRKTLDSRYEGTYRVIKVKGNQVEIPRNGTVTLTKWAHVTHLKPLLCADEIIEHLPKNHAFAHKTKLALNLDKIPDLQWQRATQLNTPTTQ